MKQRRCYALFVLFIIMTMSFGVKTVFAEDGNDERHFTIEGVNEYYFDSEAATSSDADEEVDTVNIYALPEERVEGYLTYSEAVEAVRKQMVARNSSFQIKVATSVDLEDYSDMKMFIDNVCEETSSPIEGDYLRLHYFCYEADARCPWTMIKGMYLYTVTFDFVYTSKASDEQTVNSEVKRILKELNLANDNEYTKISKIYKYMTDHIKYDSAASKYVDFAQNIYFTSTKEYCEDILEHYPNAWAAYGAVKNKCVCQGYAALFYRLAKEAGLSVRVIRGTSESGGGHAWNIVRIGPSYYNVDATWDAGSSKYDFFLKNDDDFKKHIRNSDYLTSSFYNEYSMAYTSFDASEYNPNAYATSVTITQGEKLTLCKGTLREFSATIAPAAVAGTGVKWSSSDTDILAVNSSGKVYAKKCGTAVLTARSLNNTSVYATCFVTVDDTGWLYSQNTWYYLVDGIKSIGWKKLGGTWYYFASNGAMHTKWLKYNGSWYYFNNSGAMATGWAKINGSWYYFASGGAMQTGWIHPGGKWYYLKADGTMHTGWLKYNNKWYFLNSDGAMQTGWLKRGGVWYYFNSKGEMVTGNATIGTKSYYFNDDGVYVP